MSKLLRGRPKIDVEPGQETVKTSVDITREALELLNQYAKKFGKRGPRVTILSSLIENFSRLPSPLKDLLAGRLENDMREICANMMRQWAAEIEKREPKGNIR